MLFETNMKSPIGMLRLFASNLGISIIYFENHQPGKVVLPDDVKKSDAHPMLQQTKVQLEEYFAGARMEFDVPLDPWGGTLFQRKVWESLRTIPYGTIVSYTYQTETLLQLKHSVRAVAAANGRNPLSIIVPCHRVIATSGKLQGYAGGLEAKRYLIELEEKGLERSFGKNKKTPNFSSLSQGTEAAR